MSRIMERLDELYAIGGGPGANRVHGSPAEDAAHELAGAWMEAAGLTVAVDRFGNLVGRSASRDDLWVGSHLDTVPHGGRFDGALGVVAGIEAVERSDRGSVVAFRGEEVGCVGSRAFVGSSRALPSVFLELHVEQGPVLEQAGAPLGVVTSIVGYTYTEVVIEGAAGHAGTTPMELRDDALSRAAAAILEVEVAARGIPDARATVGRVVVEPGAANVIPDRVTFTIDARAPDRERLEALIQALGVEPSSWIDPVELDPEVRGLLREQVAALGVEVIEVPSGAGHDAGILAAAGVRTGMLFVRSLNGGVSHRPDELSSEEDVALAADVLTAALSAL